MVHILNTHILPALRYSPKELLFGIMLNTPIILPEQAAQPPTTAEAVQHVKYIEQVH